MHHKAVRDTLMPALLAAALTAVMVAPVFGLRLEREGLQPVLIPHWDRVLLASAVVFVAQLLRPWLAGRLHERGLALPRLNLPSPDAGRRRILFVLVLLMAVTWPFLAGRNAIDIATLAIIYVMLGLGLNVVVGFAGLLNLGFAGFYAVGAYAYALLFHWFGWSFWQALPVAGAAAALSGFLMGFPVLRVRGDYLAIVTLGFGEIIRLLLTNLTDWTGGPDGISGIPKPTLLGLEMAREPSVSGTLTFHQWLGVDFDSVHVVIYLYLMALGLALATLYVSNRLLRMPIGRAWEALREDEVACRSLGLSPTRIKLSAFTLGAMFAGLAGAFFAARQGIVSPESFTFMESALILSIVVLGGMGSQLGVIIAAVGITVLPELAREFADYRMLMFGLVMILMMVWRPQGLLPMRRRRVEIR